MNNMVVYEEEAFKKAAIKAEILQPPVKPLKVDDFSFEVVGQGDVYKVTFKIIEQVQAPSQEAESAGELALLYSCSCPAFIGGKEPTTDPNYQPKPCYHAVAALARLDEQLEKALLLARGYHPCGRPGCGALTPPTDLLCPDCAGEVDFDQAVANRGVIEAEAGAFAGVEEEF